MKQTVLSRSHIYGIKQELEAQLTKGGVMTHLIGGADVASELDAKRAIDQVPLSLPLHAQGRGRLYSSRVREHTLVRCACAAALRFLLVASCHRITSFSTSFFEGVRACIYADLCWVRGLHNMMLAIFMCDAIYFVCVTQVVYVYAA